MRKTCKICNKSYKVSYMQSHIKTVHGEKISCPICERRMSDRWLKSHVKRCRPEIKHIIVENEEDCWETQAIKEEIPVVDPLELTGEEKDGFRNGSPDIENSENRLENESKLEPTKLEQDWLTGSGIEQKNAKKYCCECNGWFLRAVKEEDQDICGLFNQNYRMKCSCTPYFS